MPPNFWTFLQSFALVDSGSGLDTMMNYQFSHTAISHTLCYKEKIKNKQPVTEFEVHFIQKSLKLSGIFKD